VGLLIKYHTFRDIYLNTGGILCLYDIVPSTEHSQSHNRVKLEKKLFLFSYQMFFNLVEIKYIPIFRLSCMHQKKNFFSATGGEGNLAYPVCFQNRNWAQQTTSSN
jgi:hypothetical protein